MWNNKFMYRAILYAFIGMAIFLAIRYAPDKALSIKKSLIVTLLAIIIIVAIDFAITTMLECRTNQVLDQLSTSNGTCNSCQADANAK